MPLTNSTLIVFARAPRAGAAKTRLIPLLGEEGAAALHAKLVERTLAVAAAAAPDRLELHGAPADDDFLREYASRHGARLVAQGDGDIGARMHAALASAHSRGASAVLIGSDCPPLDTEHLHRAAGALACGHDAVFAPTEDGGYALIGLARCDLHVFERIPWSTDAVMEQTRARLRDLGWRWFELDTLWDVDRPADYERLLASGLMPDARATHARAVQGTPRRRSGPLTSG